MRILKLLMECISVGVMLVLDFILPLLIYLSAPFVLLYYYLKWVTERIYDGTPYGKRRYLRIVKEHEEEVRKWREQRLKEKLEI